MAVTTAVSRGVGSQAPEFAAGSVAVNITSAGGGMLIVGTATTINSTGTAAPVTSVSGCGGTWTERASTHTWHVSNSYMSRVFTCTDYVAGAGTVTVTTPATSQPEIHVMVDEVLAGALFIQGRGVIDTNNDSNIEATFASAIGTGTLSWGMAVFGRTDTNINPDTGQTLLGRPTSISGLQAMASASAFKASSASLTFNGAVVIDKGACILEIGELLNPRRGVVY